MFHHKRWQTYNIIRLWNVTCGSWFHQLSRPSLICITVNDNDPVFKMCIFTGLVGSVYCLFRWVWSDSELQTDLWWSCCCLSCRTLSPEPGNQIIPPPKKPQMSFKNWPVHISQIIMLGYIWDLLLHSLPSLSFGEVPLVRVAVLLHQ